MAAGFAKKLHANSIPESPTESSQESQRGAALTSEEKSKVDFDSLIPAEELSQILGQTENLLRNPEDKKPEDSEGQVFSTPLTKVSLPFSTSLSPLSALPELSQLPLSVSRLHL